MAIWFLLVIFLSGILTMISEFQSQYIVLSQIGEGTFSEVLKCKKISTGKTLAVKKLKKQFKHFSVIKDLPEVYVLEKLPSHPNVLPMLEYIFDSVNGKLFMIFELMDMSLYELIQGRKRCLPEARVKHMFYQILMGVDHLHTNGIFHRDIKPENILIKKSTVKLADLGSIRATHSRLPYTEYISTRWYRAPECILTAGHYGPNMDIWACGCVFYELLTSKPMFPGANEIDQLTKIHRVVGTPNPRLLNKLRHKSRVGDVKFSPYPSVNMAVILPFTSDGSRELLKRMLVYDPDTRLSARRLVEHRYFCEFRRDTAVRRLGHTSSALDHRKAQERLSGTKCTSNSSAPTKTSKVIVAESKTKSVTTRSPNKTKRKPCLNRSPVKYSNTKKTFSIRPVVKITEQRCLEQKIKSNTLGNLPAIKCRPNNQYEIKLTKSQMIGFNLKGFNSVLPPILEHFKHVPRNDY